jgi:pimeloyl-ACP methyl ester carboxylesterase
MIGALIILCCAISLAGPLPLFAGQVSDSWTREEMGNPGDAVGSQLTLPLLPYGKEYPADFVCADKSSPCTFQLAYFFGDGFDLDKKQRKNILYIPGGPGAIVDSESRSATLRLLEKKHNVVYFHPRGMAQSFIDGGKDYDRFLRADYVVEDIEKLRQAVLKSKPWDVIYAHSWGTVIAQRYAVKYGRSKDAKVKSLILSGPVDRHRDDTHGARTRMTIENLKAIFQYYRSQTAANCLCQSTSFLKPIITDYGNPQISTFGSSLSASDNFCFLKTAVVDKIVKQLEAIIPEIDANYGSADFIVDNFGYLKKDQSFQARFGKYPVELFAAIRYLQMSGAPEKDALVFVSDSRNRINAALLIAHYVTAESPSRCRSKDVLSSAAAAECEYCERFRAARDELRARMGGRESRRGNYVYGVYDGVARWISSVMGEKSCFFGKDMEGFAAQTSDEKRFVREQVKKIGIVADEKICPWNPADYRHDVPTLLIKGSRDAVIAGCQAEDFYSNGIERGSGVLLEFRGLGHDLSVGNLYYGADPSIWSKRFSSLLEDFVRMPSAVKFRSDAGVKRKLRELKVSDRSRDPKLTASCEKLF